MGQFVDDEAENMRSSGQLPDVVVIHKLYGGVANGDADAAKKRKWKLQRLDAREAESMKSGRAAKKGAEDDDMDEEDFMREVEADRDMRDQMNLYKSEIFKQQESERESNDAMVDEDNDDDDDQEIKLEELLDGLQMNDGPDQEDDLSDNIEEFGVEEGEKAAKDGINYVGREESRLVKDKEGAIPQSSFGKQYTT